MSSPEIVHIPIINKLPMRRYFQPAVARFRSLKVGQKLVLIYLLGIFLPLMITSGIVLHSVYKEASLKEHEYMLSKVNSIMDSIVREFEPLEDITEFIYTDTTIYRILARDFKSFAEFITAYNDYLLPATMKYVNVFSGISRMIIYTENPMVGVSGGYVGIDSSVRNSGWFTELLEKDFGVFTIVHVDSDSRMEYRKLSYISIFRELNNPALNRPGRLILRIDVNPRVFRRHLKDMGYEGNIKVTDFNGNIASEYNSGSDKEAVFSFSKPFEGMMSLSGWTVQGEFTQGLSNEYWTFRWSRLLGLSGLSIAFASLFLLLLSRSITSRLAKLSDHMKKVKHEDFSPINFPSKLQDEVGQLIADYNIMAAKIDELINDGYKMEIEQGRLLLERRQAEMNALQSQVNPHFLYNTLESIRMKSHLKEEHETAGIIKKLSKMFRRMTGWDQDLILLSEELSFTREYLDIQHYRFGDRLNSVFNINIDDAGVYIPKLMIQALVENACAHGLEQKEAGGTVIVSVDADADSIVLQVADDGVGCDAERVKGAMVDDHYDSKHTGLANVYRRLKLHYGNRASLYFTSKIEEGTRVTIKIGKANEAASINNSR